jgi:hypothetical protein
MEFLLLSAGTVGLQLAFDVVRQVAFALPIGYVWEFEKAVVWQDVERSDVADLPIFITGLAAGSISVLTWPHEHIVAVPLAALAAAASPLVTGVFLHRAGLLARRLGTEPPSMFAVRDATIFALGMSLMRLVMLP